MPEDSFQRANLECFMGPLQCVVPRMPFGWFVVDAWIPTRDRRSAVRTRDQADSDVGIRFGDLDAKRTPKPDSRAALVRMQRINGG